MTPRKKQNSHYQETDRGAGGGSVWSGCWDAGSVFLHSQLFIGVKSAATVSRW